jgi:uncharacterized protein YqeY
MVNKRDSEGTAHRDIKGVNDNTSKKRVLDVAKGQIPQLDQILQETETIKNKWEGKLHTTYDHTKFKKYDERVETIYKFRDKLEILNISLQENNQSTIDSTCSELDHLAEESQSKGLCKLWEAYKAKSSASQDNPVSAQATSTNRVDLPDNQGGITDSIIANSANKGKERDNLYRGNNISRWDKISKSHLTSIKLLIDTNKNNSASKREIRVKMDMISRIIHQELVNRGEPLEPYRSAFPGESDPAENHEDNLDTLMDFLKSKRKGSLLLELSSVMQKEIDNPSPLRTTIEHNNISRWGKISKSHLTSIKHLTDMYKSNSARKRETRVKMDMISRIIHQELVNRGEPLELYCPAFPDESDPAENHEDNLDTLIDFLKSRKEGSLLLELYSVMQKEINQACPLDTATVSNEKPN